MKEIKTVFNFSVGDVVRLDDGDGRHHVIKQFNLIKGIHGPDFYEVIFTDDAAKDILTPMWKPNLVKIVNND